MMKAKMILNKILGLGIKAKIIGGVATVLIIGGTTVGVLYYNTQQEVQPVQLTEEVLQVENTTDVIPSEVKPEFTPEEVAKMAEETTKKIEEEKRLVEEKIQLEQENATPQPTPQPTPAPQPQPTPAPQPVTYTEGFDSSLTSELQSFFISGTRSYYGAESGILDSILQSVANGSISTSVAVNQVNALSWQENAKNVDKHFEDRITTILARSSQCTKTKVSGKTLNEIKGQFNNCGGSYSNLVAYRHSDGSVTITNLGCSMMVQN